ncbi:Der1-like family-domain-containing protein [Jimgerdemannia flammicorona]|uniref:Derlin n=1 Tax=Jimgerdemannia flammicorona TaxID=994334 RepID=A0A433D5F0_9FUNG|nr:Der1-like family-domain-containing protein [Jimgerdemannia flammicorona]
MATGNLLSVTSHPSHQTAPHFAAACHVSPLLSPSLPSPKAMPIPIETWYYEVPTVTRTYLTAAVLTSLGVQIGFVHPLQMYFNYDLIVHGRQVGAYPNRYWRLVTNFLYFGPLSLDFLFHMSILARYSRMLEEGFFRDRTADYFWLLFLASIQLLCLTPFVSMPFLGAPLTFTLVYVWSRRNPYIRLNMLGLFVFSAPFLPWVMLVFSFLLNNSVPTGDLMGIAVGHVYYFFEDVWPQERQSGGRRWLKTPGIMRGFQQELTVRFSRFLRFLTSPFLLLTSVRLFEGPVAMAAIDPHPPSNEDGYGWAPVDGAVEGALAGVGAVDGEAATDNGGPRVGEEEGAVVGGVGPA